MCKGFQAEIFQDVGGEVNHLMEMRWKGYKGVMGEYIPVIKSSQVKSGMGQVVNVKGKRLAVFREGDRLFCVDDFCPHAGASLGQGSILEGVIYCPWHQWGFKGHSGKCVTGSIWHVDAFPIREVDGMIEILLEPNDPDSEADSGSEPEAD